MNYTAKGSSLHAEFRTPEESARPRAATIESSKLTIGLGRDEKAVTFNGPQI